MKWFVLLFAVFTIADLSAQHAFVVTGDNVKTGFGSVTMTVGQLVADSDTTRRGSVMSGIQLPIEIFRNPVSIDDFEEHISIEPYPNPTFDNIKIGIPVRFNGPFSITLTDISGHEIEKIMSDEHDHMFSLTHVSTGQYTIIIANQQKIIASYSIIKH